MIDLLRKYKDSSLDDKILTLLFTVASVFLVVAYFLSAFRSYVNADAGYYLGVVELIHKGYVPYRDFSLGYTPVFFYVLQMPRLLMGTYPDYTVYMLFLYLIIFSDAVLLSILIRRITKNTKLAWGSGIVYLILSYCLDGEYFVLEPLSVFFGLLSMLMIGKVEKPFWKVVLSGTFAALAFLSKQYGLVFAGFIGVQLLLSDVSLKKKLWNCLSALLGFCSIIALFFLLFLLSGLGPNELVEALSGSDYGGQSAKMWLEGVLNAVRLFPFLLFSPVLHYYDKEGKRMAIACFATIIFVSFQFYFNVFPHYYVYMLPFVLVLNALIWRKLRAQKVSRVLFYVYFGLLFTSVALPAQSVFQRGKTLAKHNVRKPQVETAKQLRQVAQTYNVESALCYWNTIQYYGLCPLTPSAMKEYGFSFGYDTEETYCKRLKDADCFVVNMGDLDGIKKMKGFSACLSEEFMEIGNAAIDGVAVFVKRTKCDNCSLD